MNNRSLSITFVLPGPGRIPIGGYKVVYEYANHLSRKGHQITVVHPARGCSRAMKLEDRIKNPLRYLQVLAGRDFRPTSWFRVDPEVKLICVPGISGHWVPDADVVVATAWHTAEWVSQYPPSKGRGFYLVQHLETWDGQEDKVYATWKSPLHKIVIAKWLLDFAKQMAETATYIPNGLNQDEFGLDVPPEGRDSDTVMMLYHESDWKGSADGIQALSTVKLQYPNLQAILYGTAKRPETLPHWMEYYQQPQRSTLRDLYNRSAIFVSPSWTEGWPLPPAEAMLCGAALIATDIGGHQEYAFHEHTALLAPAKGPQILADHISRLVGDPNLRTRIAHNGHKYMQQFTWARASDALNALLCNMDAHG